MMRSTIEAGLPLRRFPLGRSLHPLWLLAGCAALVLTIGGCDRPAANVADTDEPVAAADVENASPAAASEERSDAVSVTIKSWEEIIAAATAGDRPVVVDVWALSCEPCLKSFPELVRLHDELGDQVHCVSANVDYDGRRTRPPESYESDVRKFLEASDSTLTNYISATASDEVYAELDIPSIPAVLIFDADGNEVARFVDAGETLGFTYRDHVVPFVRTMIADAGAAPSPTAADPASDGDTSDAP